MSQGIKLVIFQALNFFMEPFGATNEQNAQRRFKLAQFFILFLLGLLLFVFTAQLL